MKIELGEVEFVAQALLVKVYQGDESKRGLCEHAARVAVAAHHEWGDLPLVPQVSDGV